MVQEHKFLSIEQFNDLLQRWTNSKIKISKWEMHDVDEVIMHLDKVTYKNETPTIDGYEPIHTLQLNGTGSIETDHEMSVPLPTPMYEIPLEHDLLYQFDGKTVFINTSRATYKIERNGEQSEVIKTF